MSAAPEGHGRATEVLLRCASLDEPIAFFGETLGFRIESVFPADNPSTVALSGYGIHLLLQREGTDSAAPVPGEIPANQPSFVLSRGRDDDLWNVGRADMHYRDLIPDRQGGRFIASHIRIPKGGPVPDYVHFHKIRFQMIYCIKGWVRVVYEDQGAPFVLHAGDCVLQPPEIRHRVLECSPGLEVLEIGCPAEHVTQADHELDLPTRKVLADRDFAGQRFVRHDSASATWQPWRVPGFEFRDTGIAAATEGLAGARVVRPLNPAACGAPTAGADTEFLFTFILQGTLSLRCADGSVERLEAGDCFTMPPEAPYELAECAGNLEFLEVSLPGAL